MHNNLVQNAPSRYGVSCFPSSQPETSSCRVRREKTCSAAPHQKKSLRKQSGHGLSNLNSRERGVLCSDEPGRAAITRPARLKWLPGEELKNQHALKATDVPNHYLQGDGDVCLQGFREAGKACSRTRLRRVGQSVPLRTTLVQTDLRKIRK